MILKLHDVQHKQILYLVLSCRQRLVRSTDSREGLKHTSSFLKTEYCINNQGVQTRRAWKQQIVVLARKGREQKCPSHQRRGISKKL